MDPSTTHRIDLFAALSLATDFSIGQPQQFAMKSCLLGVRLAETAGAGDNEIAAVLYQALLRYIGCNADTYLMSAMLGDETMVRREFATIDTGRPTEVIGVVLRALRRHNTDLSALGMMVSIAQGLARAPNQSRAILTGHCEVAERIAGRLDLPHEIQKNLHQLYERWDGRGVPAGLKGEAIAFPVRVVALVQDAVVLSETFGAEAARARIWDRKGSAYDPKLAALLVDRFDHFIGDLDRPVDADALRALEPGPRATLDDVGLDAAALVIADMADMRMPHTIGHSRAVAELAETAAQRLGLPQDNIRLARRAGLVHDIGEVSVPVSVWARPGPFSEVEREQVRLHPYHSERIVGRAGGAFAGVAAVAARHHERLDGSGYFRGCQAAELSLVARIVAAAEAWRNAIEPRPYRDATRPEAAAARLNAAIRAGAICPEAGGAVLEAAGQRTTRRQDGPVAGLTEREIEVLRRLASGATAREVAVALGIAPKTASNHIQNIYAKLGITTRAAAVLFAVEHGLLGD